MKNNLALVLALSACGGSPAPVGQPPDASTTTPDADLTTGQHPSNGDYMVTGMHQVGFCPSGLSIPETNSPLSDTAALVVGSGLSSGRYTVTWQAWWGGTETCDWRSDWPSVSCGGQLAAVVGGVGTQPRVTITTKLSSIGTWTDPASWSDNLSVFATCSDGGNGGCAQAPYAGNLPCSVAFHRVWELR